jgi:glyoxylase I family protein
VIRGAPSHLDLTVSDLERSVPFYARILGWLGYEAMFAEGAGAPCWGIRDAQGGVFSMALQVASSDGAKRGHDRATPGFHHFAFHVDDRDQVDRFHARLADAGDPVLDPPAEYPYTPGYYAVFFADPDGLKLEVVYEPTLRGAIG